MLAKWIWFAIIGLHPHPEERFNTYNNHLRRTEATAEIRARGGNRLGKEDYIDKNPSEVTNLQL